MPSKELGGGGGAGLGRKTLQPNLPFGRSLVATQPSPSAHSWNDVQLPPQSLSVSPPFLTPSVQLGGRAAGLQVTSQMPLWQSPFTRQPSPSGHWGQPPPQSLSVSLPFLMPSVQLGAGAVASRPHCKLTTSSLFWSR